MLRGVPAEIRAISEGRCRIWPDDPPGNPGNALQTLVSRLRTELRQGGIGDVIESHPAGYRLAVTPESVDVMAFEALAVRGRRASADGDASEAARILRDALHASCLGSAGTP